MSSFRTADSHSERSNRPPPRVATFVLSRVLPRRTTDEALGDLHEAFSGRVRLDGFGAARRWYWNQTIRFLTRLALKQGSQLFQRPDRSRGPRTQKEPSTRRDFPMNTILCDIKYAARTLLKDRGFSLIAVLILAVGIGANVAMFSVTDAVMLRSLPYPDADHLVLGRTTYGENLAWNVSAPDYYDYRDQNQGLESLAAILSFTFDATIAGG